MVRQTSIAAAVSIILAGCTSTLEIEENVRTETLNVPAASVKVIDAATDKAWKLSDRYYKTGFAPIGSGATTPSFRFVLAKAIQRNLHPDGTGGEITLTITDAVIMEEQRALDGAPFVGVVSALSPRKLRCSLTTSIQGVSSTSQNSFLHDQTVTAMWIDLPKQKKRDFVEACVKGLVVQVRNKVANQETNGSNT